MGAEDAGRSPKNKTRKESRKPFKRSSIICVSISKVYFRDEDETKTKTVGGAKGNRFSLT